MRVIAGKLRSRPLRSLPGMDVRPTTDRLRETLFNILCAGNTAALEGSGGHEGVSSRLQAVVAMAPVVDFESMPQAVSGVFAGKADLARQLAPVTYLDNGTTPFLLIHSNADKTVPIAQSTLMLERCKKLGVPAELVTIDGAPHAFWNMPQWANETIDRSARFFHSVLDR